MGIATMDEIFQYVVGAAVAAFFVAIALQLLVKPFLVTKFTADWPWYKFAVNVSALVVSFAASFAVDFASGVLFDTPQSVVATILIAFVAAALATLGYEGVVNLQRGVTGSREA